MTRARTGSLRKNAETFFAMLEAESMSHEAYQSYKRILLSQITSAEHLALEVPITAESSYHQMMVCGSPKALPLTRQKPISAPKLQQTVQSAPKNHTPVSQREDNVVSLGVVPRSTASNRPSDAPPHSIA